MVLPENILLRGPTQVYNVSTVIISKGLNFFKINI